MQRRTGLPISTDALKSTASFPASISSDDGDDDSEREEIAEELADILSELADAPLPPQVD